MPELAEWIGSERTAVETIGAWPVVRLAATLRRSMATPAPGDPLPPMWHWLFFGEVADPADIGDDGHPRRGGFLPPVPLRRRMFAGSRTEFVRPIMLGNEVRLSSAVTAVTERTGRTGPLVFVTVRDEYEDDVGPLLSEERDLVYTDAAPLLPPDSVEPVPAAPWEDAARFDPVLLFRFSALTFNGHRIHYDLPYARDVEGYPERVVHGPLIALLLLELAHANGATPHRFEFRVRAPVFCGDEAQLRGTPGPAGAALAAYRPGGTAAVTASIDL